MRSRACWIEISPVASAVRQRQVDRQGSRLAQEAARRAFVYAKRGREFGGAGTVAPFPVVAIGA